MESQSQNPKSSTESSSQAQSPQATDTAGKATSKGTSRAENVGTEQISGLNGLDSPEQARGQVEKLGQVNSQTGAAGKGKADLSSAGEATQSREMPEWQKSLQKTLKSSWTTVSQSVRSASPTQLALGAAAVGAAVWLTTRKRGTKADKRKQQTAADRWSDYPTGSDGSRSEGRYGQSGSQGSTRPMSQYGSERSSQPTGSQSSGSQYGSSQTTSGQGSGPYGQSGEAWQRPTDERWDD